MNKHTSSRRSLALVAVLGIAVIGSLFAALRMDEPDTTPGPEVVFPEPEPGDVPGSFSPPTTNVPPTPPTPPVEPTERARYMGALYEITCARVKIADQRELQTIIDEVYVRYDWDEASYRRTQERLELDSGITATLVAQMEECRREFAESLSLQNPPVAGKYVDDVIEGGALDWSKIRLSLNERGEVRGSFQGKRDDKGFQIPLHGVVNGQDGKFVASGRRGQHTARVAGQYKDGELVGAAQGLIHQRPYRVQFTAQASSKR